MQNNFISRDVSVNKRGFDARLAGTTGEPKSLVNAACRAGSVESSAVRRISATTDAMPPGSRFKGWGITSPFHTEKSETLDASSETYDNQTESTVSNTRPNYRGDNPDRDQKGNNGLIGPYERKLDEARKEIKRLNCQIEEQKTQIQQQNIYIRQQEIDKHNFVATISEYRVCPTPIIDSDARGALRDFMDDLKTWTDGLRGLEEFESTQFCTGPVLRSKARSTGISWDLDKLLSFFPSDETGGRGWASVKLLQSLIAHTILRGLFSTNVLPIESSDGHRHDASFDTVFKWFNRTDLKNSGLEKQNNFRKSVHESLEQADKRNICRILQRDIASLLGGLFDVNPQIDRFRLQDLEDSLQGLVDAAVSWKQHNFSLEVVDLQWIQNKHRGRAFNFHEIKVMEDGWDLRNFTQADLVHSVLFPGLLKIGNEEGVNEKKPVVWLPAVVLCGQLTIPKSPVLGGEEVETPEPYEWPFG